MPMCHKEIPVLVFHALFADALPPAVDPLFAVVLGAVSVVLLAQCFFQMSVALPAWQPHSLHALLTTSSKLAQTEGHQTIMHSISTYVAVYLMASQLL